jgi:hypothetical protein
MSMSLVERDLWMNACNEHITKVNGANGSGQSSRSLRRDGVI